MRQKLDMSRVEDTVDTCIIILEVELGGSQLVLGALVDSVREVVEMPEGTIEPAPKMGTAVRADYIMGMGRQGDQFIIIVDVDAIFGGEEMLAVMEESAEIAA
jgi:purine-binding chemotaxis protein CheW